MGTSDLPDIYARRPRASADISDKSRVHMLQLLCDTPPSNIYCHVRLIEAVVESVRMDSGSFLHHKNKGNDF